MNILTKPVLRADFRIPYGPGPQQFGDLWLPATPNPPLVVFFHGGWWKSEYDLGYAGYVCSALKQAGIATWSVEYRRGGSTGGGWPTTFQDVATGFNFVSTIVKSHPLDLTRVITMGHSAGGHLAFWVAGMHHLDTAGELHIAAPSVALRGAIALAGAVDLQLTIDLSGYGVFSHDKQEVYNLMGGTPHDHPDRYKQADPAALLPFNIPQILIQGTDDDQIPPQLPARYAEKARRIGDTATVTIIPNSDHFDVVDPESKAWPTILAAVTKLLRS
ncbi:MAG: alpha/beta hydrolase [Acidobacteriota bacterium]|nr:alpha/beta hydrolase [Acidobacteriota bacterium]